MPRLQVPMATNIYICSVDTFLGLLYIVTKHQIQVTKLCLSSESFVACVFPDLVPGRVQNLISILDSSRPSLTLCWDKPVNCVIDEDVTAYDIRFSPSGNFDEEGHCKMTVKAPARSIVLTRESGLKPLMKYKFEVRARNASNEGYWNSELDYIGMHVHVCEGT